jgi:vitamin-K-epoxide reductase (warfarin-sensitive)
MSAAMKYRFTAPIVLLAIIGLALSAVSLVAHYRTTPTEFCDIGETFNCDIVNRSVYSEIFNVPVALIGAIGYAALIVLAVVRRAAALPSILLFAGAALGLGFSLYLTYVEARILFVWCILCLSSLGIIALITIFSGLRLFLPRGGNSRSFVGLKPSSG